MKPMPFDTLDLSLNLHEFTYHRFSGILNESTFSCCVSVWQGFISMFDSMLQVASISKTVPRMDVYTFYE